MFTCSVHDTAAISVGEPWAPLEYHDRAGAPLGMPRANDIHGLLTLCL